MSSSRFFLGVDGGQSSTTALIADASGEILGKGTAGPCNHVGIAEGPARLKRVVLECVGSACQEAGLDIDSVSFEAACFGMSGGPHDKEAILAEVLRTSCLVVTNDAVIALSGALAGQPGIITIAGTGSISLGRNRDGQTARAGGWGYIFGDEGGAFDIVRKALRATLRQEEGWGPHTMLRTMFLEATGLADINAVLHTFYTANWPRARVAKLAPRVDEAAAQSDAVARLVLMNAARDLAAFSGSIRTRLWRLADPVTASYIGGVFQSRILLTEFQERMKSDHACATAAPMLGSAAGALLEAFRAAGVAPDLDKLLSSNFTHG